MMATVAETLQSAARSLHGHSESPRLDAELLLAKTLGLSRSGLIARGNEVVAGERERAFSMLIERRVAGAPVAYLTGTREFWSLALGVTPDVLVPRPETELLVELALQVLPREQASSVLDLGTGNGAVALAIASERPHAAVTAVDVSAPALDVAKQNSRNIGLSRNLALSHNRALSRIDWRLGSWFAPVAGERFDVIVSNPPYVAAADPALQKLNAEPALALCPGPTGLEALSAITAAAAAYLHDGGRLLLEHGSDQAQAVAQMLQRHGSIAVRSHLDFSGKPRVTLGSVHSPH
jgi:release factor glutamine methyltransferase